MSITNYDPKIWGPDEWSFLETMVRSLPEDINIDLQSKIKTHFLTLSYLLPCETCQNHLTTYIEQTKLDKLDFSKKIYVMTWINNLHNMQLDVRRPMKQVNDYYEYKYSQNTTSYRDLIKLFMCMGIILLILKRLIVRT
jgi:hypothetical protein